MNTNAVNVAVVDGKTITTSVELRTSPTGAPVRIKAVQDGKYILAEGGEKGAAPENITIKRVGSDLHVAMEGADPDQPDLIVEGFFDSNGQLVGVAEDGSYYPYISSDAQQDHSAAFLMEGVSSPQVLGAEQLSGFGSGLVAGAGIGWFWPTLLGLGALGVLGGVYAATRDNDSNKHHDNVAVAPGQPNVGGVHDNVGSKQGLIEKGESTDDTTPTFTGVGTPGNTIIIIDNGKPIGEVVIGDDGKWEFTPPPLPDGSHNIVIVEKDPGGNESVPSDGHEIIVDTQAPARSTIGEVHDNAGELQGPVANNGFTDDNTPTLSGLAEAGSTVEVFANGVKIGEVIAKADGTWEFTTDPLGDGAYSFTSRATDAAGNVGLPSLPHVITVDTVAPTKPGEGAGNGGIETAIDDFGPEIGDIGNGGTTDDNTPTFNGSGLNPGEIVTIRDGDAIIGTVIVGKDGSWEFTPNPPLTDGSHSITVDITDQAGNVSEPSDPYIVIVDTGTGTAPAKPGDGNGGIETAIDDFGPVTGNIENGGSTDDNTPTLGGQGLTPGDTVTIRDGDEVIGSVIVGEDGRWEFTPNPALADGPHSITVDVTDQAGKVSEPSDPYIIIVDTDAPAKPGTGNGGIETAIDDFGPVTGNIENGGSTDDNTPTLGGKGLTPGDTVTIRDGDEVIGSVIVGEDGSWEFTPNPALADGPHSITVDITDAVGNISEPSDPYIIIVDTQAPSKPGDGNGGIESAIDDFGPITGDIGNGGTTDDNTPTLGGQGLTPGDTVTIRNDGEVIGSAVVGEDGRWEFTPNPALTDGSHSITVDVTDAVGNVSEPSDPYIIIVDTNAPARPTLGSVIDDQGDETGELARHGTTDDSQLDLSGTADPGTTVIIYDNGVEIGRAPVLADGSWSFTPSNPLANGPHSLTVASVDASGNISVPSNPPFDYTQLTGGAPSAPSITGVIDDVPDGVGNISPGGSTNDNEPEIIGRGEAGSTISIYSNGDLLGTTVVLANGTWSFLPSPALTNGVHGLTATATDKAGNISPETGIYSIEVDTVPPVASTDGVLIDNVGPITDNIETGDTTDDNTPTYQGLAEPGTTVVIYNNGVEVHRAQVNADGTWSYTPAPPLADGAHSFSNVVVDAAGNRSPESPSTDFTVDTSVVAISIDQALDNVGAIQDPLASGDVTDDTTPTLSGRATPGSTVNIYQDGVLLQSGVPVDARGNWTYEVAPALPNGNYAFSASVVTEAGGESAQTPPFDLEVDITPPNSPVIGEISDDVGSIQLPIGDGDSTDDTTPTLNGTGDVGDTVIIRDNGVEIGRETVRADGTWSYTPNPPLNNGPHVFTVVAQDPAGNQSTPSDPWTVVVDTTPPVTVIGSVSDDSSGTPVPIGEGEETSDRTPLIEGTSEPGSVVTIFDNGSKIGTAQADGAGNWEFPVLNPLASGAHSFTASAVDPAGNKGPVSGQFEIQVPSTFGTTLAIEGFDGFTSQYGFVAGTPLERDAMDITLTRGVAHINAGVGPGVDSAMSFLKNSTVDFVLKGDPAGALGMNIRPTGDDVVIRFYAEDGSIIHLETVVRDDAQNTDFYQFEMPNGLKFSRFEVDSSGIIDQIMLLDAPIFIETFDSLIGTVFTKDLVIDRGEISIVNKTYTAGLGLSLQSSEGATLYLNGGTADNPLIANIDLKGKTAATLGVQIVSYSPGNTIEFYDASGKLIYTYDVGGGVGGVVSGYVQIQMPDGLSFSSFDLKSESAFKVDNITFADAASPASNGNSAIDETQPLFYVDEGDELSVIAEGTDATDTLVLTGANQVLDLSNLTGKLTSIEVIDLTGTGDNTLNLSLGDILEQGETSLFTDDGKVQMLINGNEGDVVNLDDLLADGTDPGDWANQGTVTVAGVVYEVYQHSSLDAELLVQQGVTTNLV